MPLTKLFRELVLKIKHIIEKIQVYHRKNNLDDSYKACCKKVLKHPTYTMLKKQRFKLESDSTLFKLIFPGTLEQHIRRQHTTSVLLPKQKCPIKEITPAFLEIKTVELYNFVIMVSLTSRTRWKRESKRLAREERRRRKYRKEAQRNSEILQSLEKLVV